MRTLIGLGLTARLISMTFPGFNVHHAWDPFASSDWFRCMVTRCAMLCINQSAGTILRKRQGADSSSALPLSWRSPRVHLNTPISRQSHRSLPRRRPSSGPLGSTPLHFRSASHESRMVRLDAIRAVPVMVALGDVQRTESRSTMRSMHHT